MERQKVGLGGAPTGPDVQILLDKYPVEKLIIGTKISWEDIAEALRLDVDGYRFRTVVGAWRKRLDRNHNILFVTIASYGLEVADGSKRINESSRSVKAGFRKIGRAGSIATRTETLGLKPEELKARDHICRISSTFISQYQVEARKLRYEIKGA